MTIDIMGLPFKVLPYQNDDSDTQRYGGSLSVGKIFYKKSMTYTCINKVVAEAALRFACMMCGISCADEVYGTLAAVLCAAGFSWPEHPKKVKAQPLPETVCILGQIYNIEISKGPFSADLIGEVHYPKSQIWIQENSSPEQKEATLVHEWTHTLLDMCGLPNKEQQVTLLATILYMEGFRIR